MIDWNQINNYISEAETILLTMHMNPDGDGLGSAPLNLSPQGLHGWKTLPLPRVRAKKIGGTVARAYPLSTASP